MIAIIDYGVGNLFSLCSSLSSIGAQAIVTSDIDTIKSADKLILPGVGAFADAAQKLCESGMDVVVKEQAASGKDIMGICLGMQLLFEKSYEYGEYDGLGLIKGSVCPFRGDISTSLKIPHMGWNKLNISSPDDPIFKYVQNGDYMYFVHSFYAKNCDENIIASAEYGVTVPALVKNKNVYGAQFHPEKSGEKGLRLLKAFAEL